jgi:hypothetical protein
VTKSRLQGIESNSLQAHSSPAGGKIRFRYSRVALSLFLLLAVLLLTVVLLRWGCEEDGTTPANLVGTWETTDPKFADRSFALTETTIAFGSGEGGETVHRIAKVARGGAGAEATVTFHYLDGEGEKWTLRVRHAPGNGDAIRIQNSKAVWKKSAAGEP